MLRSLDSGVKLLLPGEAFIDRSCAVCFSGHRENKIQLCRSASGSREMTFFAIKHLLYRYVCTAVDMGYNTFISGLSDGFDLLAAECVLAMKGHDPRLRLIGVMPFLHHSSRFRPEAAKALKRVELGADMLITTCPEPDMRYSAKAVPGRFSPDLYRKRNYFMVDNSDMLIAFYEPGNRRSGTAQTVNYAMRSGLAVHSFDSSDVQRLIDETGEDRAEAARAAQQILLEKW